MRRSVGTAPLILLAFGLMHAFGPELKAQQPTNGACFYMDADYRGDSFCVSAGESPRNVEGRYNDRISSIRIFGSAQVVVYEDENSGGASKTVTGDVSNLQDWNDRITTVSVLYTQTGSWRGGSEPQYGVCFYTDADYRGEKFCAASGESQQNVGDRYNDRISSIRVYGGAEVTVYSDDNFSGASRTFRQDASNLGDWNDRITSFKITGGGTSGYEPSTGACFYMDADYRGEKFCVAGGESQQNVGDRYNDRISSIRIYGGAEVTVYSDDNFSGASRTLRQDAANLGDWNDRITSFKITGGGTSGYEPSTGACFYTDADYRGEKLCVASGQSQENVGDRYNDRISSIRIYGGAEVTVYSDDNFSGASRTLRQDAANLGDWNDRITSFKITGGGYGSGLSGTEPLNGACFYLEADFRGDRFCMNTGDSLRNVDSRFNDRISSIRVFGNAIVTVFEDQNFSGADKTYNRSVSNLDSFNDRITSIEVR